jgi:EmrB/QacA subfamily drug resistance transporter
MIYVQCFRAFFSGTFEIFYYICFMPTVALRSPAGKWIMISAILASSMAFIDSTALNVVLPSLQRGLGASGTDLFWILNAYLLMLAALILIGGSLGDRLGRKKVFMTGILVFIGGSAACGFSPDTTVLILCRIVQGVGGALMIPGSLSLISAAIDEKEKGKAIGIWSSITTMVTVGGPILGGALADAGLWRFIFFINIPLGGAALLILWRAVEESRNEDDNGPLDFKGSIAIASGLALLTFGFLRIPALGLDNWQILVSLGLGLLLLILFILIEKTSANPMMPLHLFRNRVFSGTNALSFFLYAGLGAGMLFLSLNLVQVQGYSQLQSGLTFLPFTALMITFARYAGGLSDRHGPRVLLIVGPATAGVGLLLLSFIGQTHGLSDYWTTFFPCVLVFGLGMAFTVAPLTAAVMGSVDNRFAGTASGVNNAMTRIANVFANAIFGALAVLFFSGALQQELKGIPLKAQDRQAVMAEAGNLGNARVPASLAAGDSASAGGTGARIATAYRNSFIAAYARVLRISAALAITGALMAFVFVKKAPVN